MNIAASSLKQIGGVSSNKLRGKWVHRVGHPDPETDRAPPMRFPRRAGSPKASFLSAIILTSSRQKRMPTKSASKGEVPEEAAP